MKNGTETRPNGVVIHKRFAQTATISKNTVSLRKIPSYVVDGSPNGPWDALRNARADADGMRWFDGQVIPIDDDSQTRHVRIRAHSAEWAAKMTARKLGNTAYLFQAPSEHDFCEVPQ